MAATPLSAKILDIKSELGKINTPSTPRHHAYRAFGIFLDSITLRPVGISPLTIHINLTNIPALGINFDTSINGDYTISVDDFNENFSEICVYDSTNDYYVLGDSEVTDKFGTTTLHYRYCSLITIVSDSDSKNYIKSIIPNSKDLATAPTGKKVKISDGTRTIELNVTEAQFDRFKKSTIGANTYQNPVLDNTIFIEVDSTGKIIDPTTSTSFIKNEFTDKVDATISSLPEASLADYETQIENWYKKIGIEKKTFTNGVRMPYPHEISDSAYSWESLGFKDSIYTKINFGAINPTKKTEYQNYYNNKYKEEIKAITASGTPKNQDDFKNELDDTIIGNDLDILLKMGFISGDEKNTLRTIITELSKKPRGTAKKQKVKISTPLLPNITPSLYEFEITDTIMKRVINSTNISVLEKMFGRDSVASMFTPITYLGEVEIDLSTISDLVGYHAAIQSKIGLNIASPTSWGSYGITKITNGIDYRSPFDFEKGALTADPSIQVINIGGRTKTVKLIAPTDEDKAKPNKFYREYVKSRLVDSTRTTKLLPVPTITDVLDIETVLPANPKEGVEKFVMFDGTTGATEADYARLRAFILANSVPEPAPGESYNDSCVAIKMIPSFAIGAELNKLIKFNIKKSAFNATMTETDFYALLGKLGDFDTTACCENKICNRNAYIKAELNRAKAEINAKAGRGEITPVLSGDIIRRIDDLLDHYLDDTDFDDAHKTEFIGALVDKGKAKSFRKKLRELMRLLKNQGISIGTSNTPILPIALDELEYDEDKKSQVQHEIDIAKTYKLLEDPSATGEDLLPAEDRGPYIHERLAWRDGKLTKVSSADEVDDRYKDLSEYYDEELDGKKIVHKRRLITGKKKAAIIDEDHQSLRERISNWFNQSLLGGLRQEYHEYDDEEYSNNKKKRFTRRLAYTGAALALTEAALIFIPSPVQPIAATHFGVKAIIHSVGWWLGGNAVITAGKWAASARDHLDRNLLDQINSEYRAIESTIRRLYEYSSKPTDAEKDSMMSRDEARRLLSEARAALKSWKQSIKKMAIRNRAANKRELDFNMKDLSDSLNVVASRIPS